jgi:1-acyl-sn-glycerol-3-phosphate acyltransferase
MIYPRKNKLVRWFFNAYILRIVTRNFKQVNYNTPAIDGSKSVLLLANHFSWWDGFLLYYLNRKLFKKQFHIMVIEETMKQVFFFKYMGAFSINKNSREMLDSLHYAAELLNNPENLVLIFPQGKLHSNFTDTVKFEQGLSRIIRNAAGKFQIVFAATFVETLQYKKPSATIYVKPEAENYSDKNIEELQNAYQQHYNSSKLLQTEIVI